MIVHSCRRLTIAVAGTLALAAVLAPSMPATADPGDGHDRTLHTVELPTAKTAATMQSVAVSGSASCATPSADQRRQPDYYVSCVSFRTASRAEMSAAVGVAASSLWCDGLGAQDWWLTRTEVCIYGLIGQYTFWIEPTHEIVGTARYLLSHDINTKPGNGADIHENAFVEQIAGTGVGKATQVRFTAKCTGQCTTHDPDGYSGPMAIGSNEEALFSYTGNPVVGTPDSFRLQYTLAAFPSSGGNSSNQPIRYEFPSDIRCDQPDNAPPGCVVPLFRPTLELPLAKYGAAAVNIAIAQNYFPDGWGLTTPLSREPSEAKQDANRRAICEDGTFVPDPAVPKDSCDEFAFAASKQSGAAFGLTGVNCAEITPVFENGQWYAYIWSDGYTERCVRGHVPLPDNSAVGGELGRFTQSERLLENDQYWTAIL